MKTRVFAVCAVIFLLCGIVNAGINDGLVAYYPFNGNANDESGNGNNGTVNGATLTADRFGNADSAYHFDGNNDAILINTGRKLDGFNSMTISTWVKAENSLQVGILSKGEYTNNTSHWSYELLRDTSGGIYASVYPNDGTAAGRIEVGSAGQITNGIWNHVTYVWDSIGYIKIYINGTLVKHVISGVPTQMASTDYPLYIGRRYNTSFTYNTNWFYGSMDNIRLYNRALSEAEIQQLYKGETCSDDIAIKPYTFTAGTPAKAAEINANFDVLYQRINTPRCTN